MMKAMILAAGRGERMRPLTDNMPKPLLKVGEDALIVRHLLRLKAAGIDEIVINHAYLGYKIEEALGDGSGLGVNIAYSREKEQGLETAGGIANALDLLGNGIFLVINGDVFTDMNFNLIVNKATQLAQQSDIWAHLYLVENPSHHQHGDFVITETGLLKSFQDGAKAYTFSGIGLYHTELFRHIYKNKPEKLAPLLRSAMPQNHVSGELYRGLWIDVGTLERLKEAAQWAVDGY